MPTVRMVVRGRVQGVGFRATTRYLAEELGIVGEVWNRRDGGVELVARHEDEMILAELRHELLRGPGRVDSVDVVPWESVAANDFTIGPTR